MGAKRDALPGSVIWRQRRDEGRGRSAAAPRPPLHPGSPVSDIPRVGAADVKNLRKLGLQTVGDLLLNLPYGWDSFGGPTPITGLLPGSAATVVVTVMRIAARKT